MSTETPVAAQDKTSFLKRSVGGGAKGKPDSAPKAGKFGIPPRPQVNLMPPEIIEGRHVGVLKKRLLWGIIALVVLCALVYAAAYYTRVQAETRHDDSLAAADQLMLEKKKYSPVIQVQRDIKVTTDARTFVLSTEVDWTSYAYAIQAVLPEGVTIKSMSITGIEPGDDLAEGSDDLTQAGIAVISFSALSDTLPDASEWIEALQSVPGLATANLQSSVLQDQNGEVAYQVSATVQVTEDALANRTFVEPTADSSTDTDAGDEG
jgi:Tfp pilus assembly protein PilN